MRRTLLLLGCITALACGRGLALGSGESGRTRSVSGATGVLLSVPGELTITQGQRESLEISANDSLLSGIITEVRDGTLRIRSRGMLFGLGSVRYRLTLRAVHRIAITSSGRIRAERLHTESLEVRLTSSGDLAIGDLEADRVDVLLSGSGAMSAAGQAREQRVRVTGSASYRARELRSRQASVELTGSGDAALWVTDRLEANLTGSGDLRYHGRPRVTSRVTGSGSLESLGPH